LVILDFRERIGRDAVFDRQRMKLKDGFEHEFPFLLGRTVEVDPEEQPFVAAHEAQRFAFEVLADQLAFAENERADHRDCEFRMPDWDQSPSFASAAATAAMKASGVAALRKVARSAGFLRILQSALTTAR